MGLFDDEKMILGWFQSVRKCEVFPFPRTHGACRLYKSLTDGWHLWIDSSGKDAPPPDFYNDTQKLMMDVMRINDCEYKLENKNSVVNPDNQRENEMLKEIEQSGVLDAFNTKPIIMCVPDDKNVKSSLKQYKDSFIRTIGKHIRKIPRYKQNHPGHKIVFFICDESVFEARGVNGYEYAAFFDRQFLEFIKNSDIDYVVWYRPYYGFSDDYKLPRAVVIDVKFLDLNDKLILQNPIVFTPPDGSK